MSVNNDPCHTLYESMYNAPDVDTRWKEPISNVMHEPPEMPAGTTLEPDDHQSDASELETIPYQATEVQEVQPAVNEKVPAMLKRLLPFNSFGNSETILAPEDGGRPRRRALNT